jgi:hypothetical protein
MGSKINQVEVLEVAYEKPSISRQETSTFLAHFSSLQLTNDFLCYDVKFLRVSPVHVNYFREFVSLCIALLQCMTSCFYWCSLMYTMCSLLVQ